MRKQMNAFGGRGIFERSEAAGEPIAEALERAGEDNVEEGVKYEEGEP
jgi:hypothetical protein